MAGFQVPRTAMQKAPLLVNRAFMLLIFGVVLTVIYRYCWLDIQDPFKCSALMNNGQWLDPGRMRHSKTPYQIWQPPGCLLHEYKQKDVAACLKSKRMIFIGDSTTRQVYWSTAKKLDKDGTEADMLTADKHTDLSFERFGVRLEFIWDPFLNSSRLHEELEAYRSTSDTTTPVQGRRESAALIFIGGGLWFARHVHVNAMKGFKESIDNIIPYMNPPVSSSVNPGPFSINRGAQNLLLLAPVQVPKYDVLSPSRSETITSEKVSAMNDYMQQLSAFQGADIVWSFALMTYKQRAAYEQSGLHVVDSVAAKRADVLLNLRCNAEAATGKGGQGYPYDRTCCSNYRKPGWVQWMALIWTLVVLPFFLWITRKDRRRTRLVPSVKVLRPLLVFLLAVVYCFYADRTQVFEKKHKKYDLRVFLSLNAIFFTLGICSIRRSTSPSIVKPGLGDATRQDQPFLSRVQTDEWKGWMQVIILVYHYTGASKILWIYVLVRLLVASYLFMTGFGHTIYFYKKGDYSLRRVAAVLVRLNLLSCALPYMMRTDYLFYYFAPLVSFWFLVVYFTMRIGHSRNSSLPFLFGKIIMSAILVAAFTKIHGPLEVVFCILKYGCRIHWNIKEWRFRVLLDIFIVYVGMVAAILFVRVSSPSKSQRVNAFCHHRCFPHFRLALTLFSFAVLYLYGFLARRSSDKFTYNSWHPYVSPFPILAFAFIRNSHRHLRNYYSFAFAWLGRCSLETFTLQFHIWLAGDTKGLLDLGVFHQWLKGKWYNLIFVTLVFLYISSCVARATESLTQWITRGEDRRGGGKEAPLLEENDHIDDPPKTELPMRKSHDSGREPSRSFSGFPNDETPEGRLGPADSAWWMWRLVRIWRCEDLSVRLGFIVVVMWLLNLTYS